MKNYQVKYKRKNSQTVTSANVKASSASQAKEQIKAKYNGDVAIISAVEK